MSLGFCAKYMFAKYRVKYICAKYTFAKSFSSDVKTKRRHFVQERPRGKLESISLKICD